MINQIRGLFGFTNTLDHQLKTKFVRLIPKKTFLVWELFVIGYMALAEAANANYNGTHISSSAPASIELGASLTITTTVQNTGDHVWDQEDVTYGTWMFRVTNMVWSPGASMNPYIYDFVDPGATDTCTLTLNPSDLPGSTGNYSLTVYAKYADWDAGYFYNMANTPKIINFSIVPVANHAPTDIGLSNSTVPENRPIGTTVGTFSTTAQGTGDTFTYTLVAGSGSTDNGSFTIGGSNLQTAASFNYEVKSHYTIRVKSANQDNLSTQKVFAITVSDVNETPPAFLDLKASGGSNVVLRWSSATNHLYTIYSSTNLLTGFSVLKNDISATPAMNTYTVSVRDASANFWKVTTGP
jgi:hypothetical protein